MPHGYADPTAKLSWITPDSGKYVRVGYCLAKRYPWVNRSPHELDLFGLGYGKIAPGQIVYLGSGTADAVVYKSAPQMQRLDKMPRKDTGTLITPLTLEELLVFTTHTGELLHADFVSHRP